VTLIFILSKNDKIGRYIKKKTYKLITLGFWIKNGVNISYEFDSVFILI